MDSDGNRSVSGSNESLESFVEIEQTFGRSAQYDFPKVSSKVFLVYVLVYN